MDQLKAIAWVAGAGLAGAFTSMGLHKEKKTPIEIVIFIVSGMFTAVFLAPMICEWMGLVGQKSISAISFITGACWQFVITEAISIFKAKRSIAGGK